MDYSMDSLSDDPSFVILGSGSIPTSMKTVESLHSTTKSSASIESQLELHSSIEVQQKLDLLLRENRELRDALNQNNLAMKTQFETLTQWQQEVFQTHQSHKDKFAETRELVLKLKSENAALKNGLGVGDSKNCDGEILQQRIKQLESEKLILVKERNAFREECTRLTLKLSSVEDTLRQKCEELVVVKGNYESLSYMPASIGTREPIFNRTGSLKLERGISRESFDRSRLGEVPINEKLSINLVASGINGGQQESRDSLKSWLCVENQNEKPRTLPLMINEVEVLEGKLESEKAKGRSLQESLAELQEQYYIKCDENKALVEALRLANVADDEKNKLKEELKLKGEVLKSALSELQQEKEKNGNMTLQLEDMAILKAQVEVYQSDYKEEREAREKLVGEKEKLLEEIRVLKATVSELENKFNQGESLNEVKGAASSSTQGIQLEDVVSTSAVEEVPEMNIQETRPLACPVCLFRFARTAYNECERHVNHCLDVSMLPC